MYKAPFFLILILFFPGTAVFCERHICAQLTDEGELRSRLRILKDDRRLSLIMEADALSCRREDMFRVEPSFRGRYISAGRIDFSGLFTEIFNPDNINCNSGCLKENSKLKINDSFTGGLRSGLFAGTEDISSWLFRKEEAFSTGLILPGFAGAFPESSLFKLSSDFLLSAGKFRQPEDDSWFSEKHELPGQYCINAASEMRISLDDDKAAGRSGFMRPGRGAVSAAVSALAAFSFPQYTTPGQTVRIYAVIGKNSCFINGLIAGYSDSYLPPSGEPVDYSLIAGSSFVIKPEFRNIKTALKLSYLFKRNREKPVPARVIEQNHGTELNIFLENDWFRWNVGAEYFRAYDENSIFDDRLKAESLVKIKTEIFSAGVCPGLDIENPLLMPVAVYSLNVYSEIKSDSVKIKLSYKYDEGHRISSCFDYFLNESSISLDLSLIDFNKVLISAGFDTLSK